MSAFEQPRLWVETRIDDVVGIFVAAVSNFVLMNNHQHVQVQG